MRKQNKIVAVASAAALLAIGASMTSFAATGWVEEDGVWYFYDRDGVRVEDEWKKSGDNWYWLDSEEGGAMATDKLVDDDGDIYYVDGNGIMVTNTWVKVVNEEQDDDNEAEYNYYYMQSSGKAYTAGSSESTKFRTIDGKRYAFDADGKMLWGWVGATSNLLNDDEGWHTDSEDIYYCGSWEDGSMKTGWQYLNVYDPDDDDNEDHWFYFNSNGKRFAKTDTTTTNYRSKTVNGKKYSFDNYGVMVYEWVIATGSTTGTNSTVSNWQYFNSPEDGARVTKGWFKVIPPNEDNSFLGEDTSFDAVGADDEDEYYYYADGNGNLYNGAIKKIKGKYYGFAPEDSAHPGRMLNALTFMKVNADGTIAAVEDFGVDSDELDQILNNEYAMSATSGYTDSDAALADGYSLYYFGNNADTDGALKTGNVTVSLDGDSYQFTFRSTGAAGSRGKGLTGIDDSKYIYKAGLKIKADSTDKYQVVYVDGVNGVKTTDNAVTVTKISAENLSTWSSYTVDYENTKEEDVKGYGFDASDNLYAVNTSGTLQKKKNGVKDGYDMYFGTDANGKMTVIVDNKSVVSKNTTLGIKTFSELATKAKSGNVTD